jgi:hypothetical protein
MPLAEESALYRGPMNLLVTASQYHVWWYQALYWGMYAPGSTMGPMVGLVASLVSLELELYKMGGASEGVQGRNLGCVYLVNTFLSPLQSMTSLRLK